MVQYVVAYCSAVQRVAVRCSVLQCVAICCGVSRCVAMCCSMLQFAPFRLRKYDWNTKCADEFPQLVHLCAVSCCSVLQCVAACCSVLQCVAVCCSVDDTSSTSNAKGADRFPQFFELRAFCVL